MTKIVIYDIGAAGGINRNLSRIANSEIVGFEPNKNEAERLSKVYKDVNIEIYPYAIGSGKEKDFYVTERMTCASLREPNVQVFNQFDRLGSERNRRGNVKKVIDIETITINEFNKRSNFYPDFIKIDVQGAEYEILENADLTNVLGLEVEVEFIELYKGQKLFRDIDELLCKNGFQLYGLKRNKMKLNDGKKFRKYIDGGVLVHADALYFKNKDDVNGEQKAKIGKIAEAYELIDLALFYNPYHNYKRHKLNVCINYLRSLIYTRRHKDRKAVVDFDVGYKI